MAALGAAPLLAKPDVSNARGRIEETELEDETQEDDDDEEDDVTGERGESSTEEESRVKTEPEKEARTDGSRSGDVTARVVGGGGGGGSNGGEGGEGSEGMEKEGAAATPGGDKGGEEMAAAVAEADARHATKAGAKEIGGGVETKELSGGGVSGSWR